MVLSDFLAIIDILVTVLIGFVITHMVYVRDSKTRAIKDYYIQELTEIRSEINEFYSNLFKGELSSQEIIGWYSAIRNRIDNFDNAVRKTFKIYEARLTPKLFFNYKNITNCGDFNVNFKQGKIMFKANTKIAIGKNQKQLYMLIERTLYDINNVSARDYISRKWREFKSHYLYYRVSEKKTKKSACVAIAIDWLNAHKSSIIAFLIFVGLTMVLCMNLGRVVKLESDEQSRIELIHRLDSLNVWVKGISEKKIELPPATETPSEYSIRLNEITSSDTTTLKGWIKVTK